MKLSTTLVSLAIAAGAAARQITIYNHCPFTIWYVPYVQYRVRLVADVVESIGQLYVCTSFAILSV